MCTNFKKSDVYVYIYSGGYSKSSSIISSLMAGCPDDRRIGCISCRIQSHSLIAAVAEQLASISSHQVMDKGKRRAYSVENMRCSV